MATSRTKKKRSNLKPTAKQLAARAKFAAAAKLRARKGEYSLSVLLGGKTFDIQTDNLKDAILSLKPEKITNKVMVTASRGDKKITKLLFVLPARRVFSNQLSAEFFAKSLMTALN